MRFFYQHKASINPLWVPDEEVNECYCCSGIFTFSVRRHHCRLCGNVVCDSCSRTREKIKGYDSRICRACNTYLWIRRSGQTISDIMQTINKCLTNYYTKWQNLKILLRSQSEIIKQIQNNQKLGNMNDDNVTMDISEYTLASNYFCSKHKAFDLKKANLQNIESLLDYERNESMIYFVGYPPKHNPKLSPWTRRLLLITKDSKMYLSSPLNVGTSLYQMIESQNEETMFIHFQYYAPLNRLFQSQIIPIQSQFEHIKQFNDMNIENLIIYMTKRNAKPKKLKDFGPKSNEKNKRKMSTPAYTNESVKESNNHYRNWSYFKDKVNVAYNQFVEKMEEENDANTNENNGEEHKEITPRKDMFNVPKIDANTTNPTLVLLPFCVQLYEKTYFKELELTKQHSPYGSRRASLAKLPSIPPPKPPMTESLEVNHHNESKRKKSLGDVLPEPHKPMDVIQRDASSPPPPLPSPHSPLKDKETLCKDDDNEENTEENEEIDIDKVLSDIDENDENMNDQTIKNENKQSAENENEQNEDAKDEIAENVNEQNEEKEAQNGKGFGFMNRFFRKQSIIKETNNNKSQSSTTEKEPVYSEYIRKFSSFSFFDNDKEQTKESPKAIAKLNGLSENTDIENEDIEFESDIVLHPQHNMFSDADWQCLEFKEDDFEFNAVQDLYDVLNCHKHKYLRSFYQHIVAFHHIIDIRSNAVIWSNDEHKNKLRILWEHIVIHTPMYKEHPLTFDDMLSIKDGKHCYWKEIGFQGMDPITDFRGMGELALDCLVYFALNYNSHCQVIFSKKRAADNYYPLCASFINIVNLICELTNAQKVEELDITQQTPLFKLFIYENVEDKPFEELFCLICRVFDNVWRATKSFYWDFPKLYNGFRDRIEYLLSKEPINLKQLMLWLETDSYIFEYKEADFNKMDLYDSNLIYLNGN